MAWEEWITKFIMTIEAPQVEDKNPLQKVLFNIAVDIDVPANRWERIWYELALKVGYTEEQIEKEASKKRPT